MLEVILSHRSAEAVGVGITHCCVMASVLCVWRVTLEVLFWVHGSTAWTRRRWRWWPAGATFKDLQAHGVFPTLCSLGFSEARGGGVGFCLLFTGNLFIEVYRSNFKRNPFLAQPQQLPVTDNLVRSTSDIPPNPHYFEANPNITFIYKYFSRYLKKIRIILSTITTIQLSHLNL